MPPGSAAGNSALLAAAGARWRHAARRGPSGVGRTLCRRRERLVLVVRRRVRHGPQGAVRPSVPPASGERLPACPCGGAGVSKDSGLTPASEAGVPRADRLHHAGHRRRRHRFLRVAGGPPLGGGAPPLRPAHKGGGPPTTPAPPPPKTAKEHR